ncbi:MAG: hypothetical protein M3N05_07650, partial [Pseudomonadota bacterium]|nr:hypothetical protein [Pseudomonadota bacterium]
MRALLIVAAFSFAGAAAAQDHDHMAMPGMETPMPAKPAPAASTPKVKMDDMAGMDMSSDMAGMAMGHDHMFHNHMAMSGNLAAYPASRDATGTAWQPDSAKHEGWHFSAGPWMLMAHGEATLVYDDQGGPRGQSKSFVESFAMVSAQRALDGGTLTVRAHGSLD